MNRKTSNEFHLIKMNKMKILAIISLVIPFIGLSQTYQQFPTGNAIWKEYRYHLYVFGGGNKHEEVHHLHYLMNGDTTISNSTYKKIYYTGTVFVEEGDLPYSSATTYNNNEYVGAIREDAMKRVYVMTPNNTSEMLLYDFNLSVGDTITSNFIVGFPDAHFTVGSIDSVLVTNNYHKRYHIIAPTSSSYISQNGFNNLMLIEGIGSSLGLFQFRNDPNYNNIHELVCFKRDGVSLHPTGYSCDVIFNVGVEENSFDQPLLYPNPTTNTLYLNLDKNYSNLLINIYSLDGKLIEAIKKENTNDAIFELTRDKGVYFIEIFTDGHRSLQKVIKN